MCGICGIAQRDGHPITEQLLRTMNDTIAHRGPDGEGIYCGTQVGLAMRRLSIIDVAGSDQPLYNENREIAVVFNGEIYNFRELRQNLIQRGHTFHTDGDGETIAHLYEDHGIAVAEHLRGMFAFALWDNTKKQALIARDRFGKKPLYYYHRGDVLVFASEIKALLQHPAVPRISNLNTPANLALYLAYGYMPAPMTAFQDIFMLMPGHSLTFDATTGTLRTHAYWQPPQISDKRADEATDLPSMIARTRELLRESVALRMIADVPLGAFLSGGLDSSLIVALMQQMSNQPVKTFSIGFEGDQSFDETHYAQEVATHLGTDHTAFTVKPHAMDLLHQLVWYHDQPFADSSAIPTFLVSQLTRQHVTVALSGDGGDELFAGYERFYAASLAQRLIRVPRPVWRVLANLIGVLPEGTGYYNQIKRAGRFVRAGSLPLSQAYFDWVRVANSDQIYDLTQSDDVALAHFKLPKATLAGILHANQTTYLPDDLLIKADRSSMGASLEVRAPFLDHHLAEWVATLPINVKLKGNITKYLLKESARGLLPDAIIDRKKHGFGVPLGAWLKQDSSVVRDLLTSKRAKERGLLNATTVETLIQEHESGKRDHNRLLWTLLTLESWHTLFVDDFQPQRFALSDIHR